MTLTVQIQQPYAATKVVQVYNGFRGPKGDKGDPGDSAGDKSYVHSQSVASDTWVIMHSLGKYPSVVVIDSAGDECEGLRTYDSLNQMTLKFSAAFSGQAFLN